MGYAGANGRTLMALGGWKSPAILSRYAHPSPAHFSPAHLWSAVERLMAFKGQISDETVTGQNEQEGEETQPLDFTGEPRATRTHGPRLKRAMLYQLS